MGGRRARGCFGARGDAVLFEEELGLRACRGDGGVFGEGEGETCDVSLRRRQPKLSAVFRPAKTAGEVSFAWEEGRKSDAPPHVEHLTVHHVRQHEERVVAVGEPERDRSLSAKGEEGAGVVERDGLRVVAEEEERVVGLRENGSVSSRLVGEENVNAPKLGQCRGDRRGKRDSSSPDAG